MCPAHGRRSTSVLGGDTISANSESLHAGAELRTNLSFAARDGFGQEQQPVGDSAPRFVHSTVNFAVSKGISCHMPAELAPSATVLLSGIRLPEKQHAAQQCCLGQRHGRSTG